ncbi:hypothetical protein K440DRAFT_665152, partial [Wilcoxina mikolae CBS 423.85]
MTEYWGKNTTQPLKANPGKDKATTGTSKVQSKAPAKGGRKDKSLRSEENGEENYAYTPLFVSEAGGNTELQLVHGRVRELPDNSEYEDESAHPPTGGANNPLKRGKSLGSGDAKKVKMLTPGEEAIESL